jgi:rhamnose utilization protein RhaD (predicted bifunctional aldolase and dehydrogenase)/NAD(P)-dependent dehydrogenase (short-subunit alcohol dehydrogenase family)
LTGVRLGPIQDAMENLWSHADAQAAVARYAEDGIGEDVALRIYTTRLLGGEPRLVQHGGGNTSVKTIMHDIAGNACDVLCVKGSGWDMGHIESPGLPAMRLEAVQPLLALDTLSHEDMVNALRLSLLDSKAPNPSVEALLHAFLPDKFIDHTHAWPVLALTDQPNGAELSAEVYGERAALMPYIMPGFALAQKAYEVRAANPDVEGLVLLKHGIFSFGESAEEAYRRMIELVGLAEERLAQAGRARFVPVALPTSLAPLEVVSPVLRGLLGGKCWLLDYRGGEAVLDYVNGEELERYGQAGVVTPDHVIRMKGKPLLLPAPEAGKLNEWRQTAEAALNDFAADYDAYFARNNGLDGVPKTQLDSVPRVVMVRGLGLFGIGASADAARIAADLAEATVAVIGDAEGLGRFTSIDESNLFDVEYWSLEQAKLGNGTEKPLAGQIAAVTGGAGTIGAAIARTLAGAGATVMTLDLDGNAADLVCDVTDQASVDAAFIEICCRHGGLDILVSNAGATWQGRIGEVDETALRQSFELNFFGHQRVAQAAVKIMLAQGTGGVLLFNASKQAVNPGRDFGPYGLPKAATLFLSRQYALDYGSDGIRANAVNADRIRSGLMSNDMIAARANARGLAEETYMSNNLLGCEVMADDVAEAFLNLALAKKTTGAVMTVDGGNIAAALR